MQNRSIVSRLIWQLAFALAGVWLLGSVSTALLTRFEVNERLDNALEEVAQRLTPLADDPGLQTEATQVLGARMLPAANPQAIAYQIMDKAGHLVLRSPNAPAEPFISAAVPGFRDTRRYRVYTGPAGAGAAYWLQVAEPQSHRSEALGRSIELAALPLLAFLPLCWIVIRWSVRRSFRPLIELQRAIGTRGGADLSPIPDLLFPAELLPIHQAVNRLLERLERALRLERQFAANSAYEMRTPIAGALAQLQLLAAQLGASRHAARTSLVIQQIKGLGELTEKLLQLSRAESGLALSREPVDLLPALRILIDEFRRDGGGAYRFEVDEGASGTFIVRSDVDVLGIAIRNLLENAVRYGVACEPIRVSVLGNTIVIANGGAVVPPEVIDVLTQPFKRATTVGQGRGLGLAIVDSIMQQAGGHLVLTSPPAGYPTGFEAMVVFPEWGRPPPAMALGRSTPRFRVRAPALTKSLDEVRSDDAGATA